MGRRSPVRHDLFGLLPEVHATVLRMRAEGASDDRVAEAVGVSPEAVSLLVELAERKLRRLAAGV